MGARPSPRHRLGPHNTAVRAAQQAQLALNHAARRAEVQVAPTLDAPLADDEPAAGLPAARAHPPAAEQPDGHDHPLAAETDIND